MYAFSCQQARYFFQQLLLEVCYCHFMVRFAFENYQRKLMQKKLPMNWSKKCMKSVTVILTWWESNIPVKKFIFGYSKVLIYTYGMYRGLLELIFPFYALQFIYHIRLSSSCFPYTSLAEHHHIFCSLKRQLWMENEWRHWLLSQPIALFVVPFRPGIPLMLISY